jgi:transposase
MLTTVTHNEDKQCGLVLHVAFELAEKSWKLAFTTGLGQKPRVRSVAGGDLEAVDREIASAKRRFNLPEEVRVVSCQEAGMEGFWLHRALEQRGIQSWVVDSSSIDIKRGRRTAKTDRLDVVALVRKLVQFREGQHHVWSVVRVPPAEAEDLRHNDRELTRLVDEQTALSNTIRGLLKTQGIRLGRVRDLPQELEGLRSGDGRELGTELKSSLRRVWERLQVVRTQIEEVKGRRTELLENSNTLIAQRARQLLTLRAVGENLSWELATEVLGWRTFRNRREVGGLIGAVPVPYQSGDSSREQGISKLGRRRLRASLIELAWLWLRYQPNSPVARWYRERFASGSKRLRRIGIVGVARRLLIDLWRFCETGVLPDGVLTKA